MQTITKQNESNNVSIPEVLANIVEKDKTENFLKYTNRFRQSMPGPDSIHMVSNSYLGLTGEYQVAETQFKSAISNVHESLSSPLCINRQHPQRKLEQRFAEFIGKEDTVICQSGWSANYGLLKHIAQPGVPVYLDSFAHSSLWEGARASGARCLPFQHNNVERLRKIIARRGAGIVIVDSIYSTNGDICPLQEIADLVEETGSVLVVDEAHSFGTHGEFGEGLVAELGLVDKVHFITASLAKAFAGRGGIVAASASHCEFFRFTSEPFLFSSKILTHEIEAINATLNFVQRDSWRRQTLKRNALYLRHGLAKLGYEVEVNDSHIVGLVAGPIEQGLMLHNGLESRDVFGAGFCPPATPKNKTLVRFAVTANHSLKDLDKVLTACAEVREDIDLTLETESQVAVAS